MTRELDVRLAVGLEAEAFATFDREKLLVDRVGERDCRAGVADRRIVGNDVTDDAAGDFDGRPIRRRMQIDQAAGGTHHPSCRAQGIDQARIFMDRQAARLQRQPG